MKQSAFNGQLLSFLQASPTPYHAVAGMAERLQAADFIRLDERSHWTIRPGQGYLVVRDGALVAFRTPAAGAAIGWRMLGAHTDSPCLKVKPQPVISQNGYLQLGVEVYGGALLNPWFDRDLSLAGRVNFRNSDGGLEEVLIDLKRAVATIPSLAIHLDREANKSRSVNPQTDLPPLLCRLADEQAPDFSALLRQWVEAEHPGKDVAEVLDFELFFYDTQAPALVGLHEEFIASARLDNLLSCYTGLQALLDSDSAQGQLLICNDHEEVGSQSATGAQGPLLQSVLERLYPEPQVRQCQLAASLMISADNAHGVHPNYADRHDGNHGPLLNAGPVIKVNANQRYATSSFTSAVVRHLAQEEQVPVQAFVVRTDMACGSTIGPITAAGLGVRVLDIGVPTFAMHSVRELAGSLDAHNLYRLFRRFLAYSD